MLICLVYSSLNPIVVDWIYELKCGYQIAQFNKNVSSENTYSINLFSMESVHGGIFNIDLPKLLNAFKLPQIKIEDSIMK